MTKELIGCFPDMTNEDYHENQESYSRSALMEYMKSPYHYWARYLNPDRPPSGSTEAMDFGTLFHTIILEPHLFDEQFILAPERKTIKDHGREAQVEYKAELKRLKESGVIFISPEKLELLNTLKRSLMANNSAHHLLEGTEAEKSYFWKDENSGLIAKCRPDALHRDYVIDIKTTADAEPEAFKRSIYKYGYHIQAAMMLDGINAVNKSDISVFIFIVVESTYPHCVGIYFLDETAINIGRNQYKEALKGIRDSTIKNNWPYYKAQATGLPQWLVNKLTKEDNNSD